MEWSNSLLRHFKIQTLFKTNCSMAAISAFGVTQHSQIFSLFFRNRIQCIALCQLHNSQALLNLRQNHSPNMVMSRDPAFKFREFYFSPNSVLNFYFPTLECAKYFHKVAATAGPSCGEMGLNSQNKNCRVSLMYITK